MVIYKSCYMLVLMSVVLCWMVTGSIQMSNYRRKYSTAKMILVKVSTTR